MQEKIWLRIKIISRLITLPKIAAVASVKPILIIAAEKGEVINFTGSVVLKREQIFFCLKKILEVLRR